MRNLVIYSYLKIFLQVVANNLDPQDDQRVKHNPPPPTRLKGIPLSFATSQIIMFMSAKEQDTNTSP